jgi:hypothetical protein
MLSSEMAAVLEELKAEFPPPEEANHHRQRVEMVSRALMNIETYVVRVSMQCGMSEADASAHFRNIKPHIQHVNVVTGKRISTARHNNTTAPPLGDLTEQHPILLETLLCSGTILFIPEVWLFRSVFSVGFGPVKGWSLYVLRLFLSVWIACKVHPLLGRKVVFGVHLLHRVAGLRACSQPGWSTPWRVEKNNWLHF